VDLTRTRTALHGIAELLLAGPQYAASGTIRLRVVPGGIATVAEPDLRLEGTDLVGARGRHPLRGRYADIAAALGVTPRLLDDVYRDRADVTVDDEVDADPDALRTLVDALAVGDAALRAFAPGEEPVLWPEHLDVAISSGEVNYGASPGDAHLPEPYAYVGPWTPRAGGFWNQSFGAARPLSALGGADAVADFFREGAEHAAADPVAEGNAR
jgi:hypothetical protein